MYDDLVAMVFASHTLEGYFNFIGDKISPGVWQNERDIQGGLEGKLALILRECGLPYFDKDRRPYATIAALVTSVNVVENGGVAEAATAQAALGGSCRVSLPGVGFSSSAKASTPM
jgi:hypothetical protein